mgnify:CR=1 FL=1
MSRRAQVNHADTFARLWQSLAPNGAPPLVREFQFAKPRRYKFDFACVAHKVAIEIDGGQWMKFGGRHATDTDREKLNLAAWLGWRVLRYSPEMLDKSPYGVIEQVCDTIAGMIK